MVPSAGAPEAGGAPAGAAPDEVDRIVAAWRRVAPGVDVEPLEVLSRVARLAHHLDRLRRSAFASHALETWEFDVLAALRRAGEPHELSPGQLVVQTLVTSGTMTNRVDRLERRGLVQRRPAPDDGRSVLVRLTVEGARAVDAALADLVAAEDRMLAVLPPDERRALASLLRRGAGPGCAGGLSRRRGRRGRRRRSSTGS